MTKEEAGGNHAKYENRKTGDDIRRFVIFLQGYIAETLESIKQPPDLEGIWPRCARSMSY